MPPESNGFLFCTVVDIYTCGARLSFRNRYLFASKKRTVFRSPAGELLARTVETVQNRAEYGAGRRFVP
jgi:hypothetical protein